MLRKFLQELKISLPSFGSTVSTKDLMTITQQLATLVDSGLTLDDGLSTLVKLAETEKIRFILSDIRERGFMPELLSQMPWQSIQMFSQNYISTWYVPEKQEVWLAKHYLA